MNGRIKQVLREATGPSFEERIAAASANFRRQALETERKQTQIIEDAKMRAKQQPSASAVRPKELVPPSVEERAEEHARVIRENTRKYASESAARTHRMKTREPLFRVSEVQAAFEQQRQRQAERRKQLADEEARQWQHIAELQDRVVHRPLLVEDYQRPVHSRTVPNLRLIPEHTKDTPLQSKVHKAISRSSFQESDWGQEVLAIRDRQNKRPGLHEISYPPKQFQEKQVPAPVPYAMDLRMKAVIAQPWYQKSEWSEKVKEIRQRQDDRPKLHEITYPPKGA